jgi:hypothetical protein
MKTLRIALVSGVLATMLAGATYAQAPADLSAGQYRGFSPLHAQQMTPLATIGDLSVGIWTPLTQPYDVTANRSAAGNPLP